MLRVCEKLRETDADAKGRRYGLARAETGYLRALVDAMADMDRLAEVELLKSLGDVNLEKGRLGKDVGKLNMALALYVAAVVRCDHRDQGESIEHRYEYTERLLHGVSSTGSQSEEQSTEEKTTPAKVAEKFQYVDRKRATGGNTDSVLVGYAQLMVEGIVNDNSMLETEAIKSLGDVYLKRGTESLDTLDLTRASALYNKALTRCHNVQGTVVIVHRLLHTAKIRQDVTTTETKRSARKQRQQDVTERKDHFSSFSAEPSSDRINVGMRSLKISYHSYLQTVHRDLGNGDLDAAEQNLAAALKLVHDPSNPDKAREADCLCRLGDVYVERGKRTGDGRKFTQAAALYNASMARTDGDKQSMVTRLQETERQFLRNTCNINCEPCPYSSALDHIKELDNMRARVKSQLDTIHQEHNPYQFDEDDPIVREIEIKRAEAIKNLFKRITADRQEFIQVLTDECIAKLGPLPCKYAFIGLGSQATELVTPYSDLEFAILIEEGKDDEDTRRYFLNLTHYLHLKVINLGETILPAMAIPTLNDFLSEDPEKDWFFDSVTPRGFAFDGFMPWASKTPFGRGETKSKPPISLIQTPTKLAKYQDFHIALVEGYHLSDILRRVAYLTGDESLVNDYTNRVNKSIKSSPVLSRLSATLKLKNDLHARKIVHAEPNGELLDVKKEIYRFPSVAVDMLSICCGITIPSVWGMIEELGKTQQISQENAYHLSVLISISAELRLRTYIANGGQKDRLSPLTEMETQLDKHDVDDTFVQTVFYMPDSKMLFRYYYTAIPLKKCIMHTVEQINSTAEIFPTPIFDKSFQTRGKITLQLFHLDASVRYFKAALEETGTNEEKQFEILYGIGNVLEKRGDSEAAIGYYKRSLRNRNAIDEDSKLRLDPENASLLERIGNCFNDLGDQIKAISYYEQALKMRKAIHGTRAHLFIASIQSNIGSCWSKLGDPSKAASYQEHSLQIMNAIHGKNTPHPHIALLLNNIGKCWHDLGDERKALSHFEQSLKMTKAIYGPNTAHPDIAGSLNNIGSCWGTGELGDLRKAIRYYEQSLKMMKIIYGETTAHPEIATTLGNIGNFWNKLCNHKKAISFYEHSIKMLKAIYGESTAHRDIAASLNNIGSCWSSLGDKKKAIRYFKQSLKMEKAMYGGNTAHPDISVLLRNIAKCWGELGDQRKSIRYHEQSLKMLKAIYGETTEHPQISSSLNHLGLAWSKLGDQKKAISYYEQSLKMKKAIYGETSAHLGIAVSLNNMGTCWDDLGEYKRAISFYEHSMKMLKAIYGESTAHQDIAASLNNIAISWSNLGDKRKAIGYYEQSQNIWETIYGNNTAHPDISVSLNNMGSCWSHIGNHRKAISNFERSLKMMKAFYGETAAHPDIAISLNNIGNCWSKLGDPQKSISFYEQSINMCKTVYGATAAHPHIASALNNMGTCWGDLGDQRKAMRYHEQSLKMWNAIYGKTTAHPHTAMSLNNIGTCWSELGDQRKAISFYEKSVKMRKTVYGERTAHLDIAISLNDIGKCWCDLRDQGKAISFYEQSLKMMKVIYGKTTVHPDIAASLNNIGTCWGELGDNGKAIRYYEQSLKMRKAVYGERTEHPDIAASLNNIGTCWNKLGHHRKAISYQEQALKMSKAVYGETTTHPDIAASLINIGSCWSGLGDQKKAVEYYEQSLKMYKTIYGEANPKIAKLLNNIGTCLIELGDHCKAILYCEQSLKMWKAIYGETTAHPVIALSLNNIGNCWNGLGDRLKAMWYYEQSLEMRKVIYGDNTAHPYIASALQNIQLCKSSLRK
uniref:Protein-PII uridylyltransferase N-terminal domain-containing protein n=1 Tax=Branchiostoma floridae TaxID=7739 RepID=C3ZDQ8_BRAFL|eukprot:XP_002592853.1 hypothetical protein BRAFLDRAFT_65434 [Branchiostoma floridae]